MVGLNSVIGHQKILNRLSDAISKGQNSHAYLITGPDSAGKNAVARYLASALNCENISQIQKYFHKKIILIDRFTDSTIAYQVYGKGVNNKLVDIVHKHILGNFKPDLTFIIKVKLNTAFKRLKKRSFSNRYDKFPKSFYSKVQNAFVKISAACRLVSTCSNLRYGS